jgi:hypothetical protein
MSELFYCVVEHPAISEAIQRVAFENGFDWNRANIPEKVKYTEKPILSFWNDNTHPLTITYRSGDPRPSIPRVTIEECLEKLRNFKPSITVNGDIVKAKDGDLIIGCLTIKRKKVEALYKMSTESM